MEELKIKSKATKIIVAQEEHKEEGVHYHCYLYRKNRFNYVSP